MSKKNLSFEGKDWESDAIEDSDSWKNFLQAVSRPIWIQ